VILRVLNLVVIGVLVLAAAYVYRIKFDATVQAERLARLRGELRHERDKIAALRAEWEQLDSPARIETLAKRHLPLRPISPTQFDALDRLPERPAQDLAARADPIGGIIENLEQPSRVEVTGTLPAAANPKAPAERSAGGIATGALPNDRRR
jgi:cell division protein FtsL